MLRAVNCLTHSVLRLTLVLLPFAFVVLHCQTRGGGRRWGRRADWVYSSKVGCTACRCHSRSW